MSQHLNCALTYVNQIPIPLLLGPSSPLSHHPSIHPRYATSMFSIPRPQYITPISPTLAPISQIIEGSDKVSTKEIRKLALEPLEPTGQGKGEAIGFFEQGIITGATVMFGIVVPGVLYTSWVLRRKGVEYLRRGH